MHTSHSHWKTSNTAVSFVSRMYNLVTLVQYENGAHFPMLAMDKDVIPPGFPREMMHGI